MPRIRPMALLTAAVALTAGLPAIAAAETPKVVTTIKPLHSLVAGVMDGVGEPYLLIRGAASPHTYALRPSDAQALQDADVVFWIDETIETFLVDPLDNLPQNARIVELFGLDGMTHQPVREGGAWEGHDHSHGHGHAEHGHDDHGHDDHGHAEHDHDDHGHDDHGHAEHDHDDHGHDDHGHAAHDDDHDDHGHAEHGHHAHGHGAHAENNSHIWLDPGNAAVVVDAVVATLSDADPAQAARYAANGESLKASLDALDRELSAELAPLAGRPYIVFHDAYPHFEERYGLTPVGSITIDPHRQPGAERLRDIRAKIVESDAICVFSEPQFEPRVVQTVAEGTDARIGVLDPLGAELTPGPEAYPALLRNLASALRDCLLPAS